MSDRPPLFTRLDASVSKIVDEYQRLTDVPPWNQLCEKDWRDHLPPLLHALLTASLIDERDHPSKEATVELAAIHGATRRKQGFTPDLVLQEYYLMRNATWKFINTDATHHDAVASIIRLDAAISIATLACLAGFHRDSYEKAGKWPAVLKKMVTDWERTI